jgi:FkbM family methyltransferase
MTIPLPPSNNVAETATLEKSKALLFRASAQMARAFMTCFPFLGIRRFAWRRLIRPYLAWRPLHFEATSKFGAIFHLSLNDLVQRYIFFFGSWEPEITEYICSNLESGDVFSDVGANIGYYSLLASKCVGDNGKVYAIEASPKIFVQLSANINRNSARNIIALNCAACDKRGHVSVYLHGQDNCGATTIIAELGENRSAAFETVIEAFPLQDIIPVGDIERAKIIKIDVEGAEWLVLNGLSMLLDRLSDRTEILVEANAAALRTNGASLPALVELLNSAGFCAYVISYDEDSYLQCKPNPIKPWNGVESDQVDFLFRRGIARPPCIV